MPKNLEKLEFGLYLYSDETEKIINNQKEIQKKNYLEFNFLEIRFSALDYYLNAYKEKKEQLAKTEDKNKKSKLEKEVNELKTLLEQEIDIIRKTLDNKNPDDAAIDKAIKEKTKILNNESDNQSIITSDISAVSNTETASVPKQPEKIEEEKDNFVEETTKTANNEPNEYAESIHKYLKENIYNKFVDYDNFLEKVKDSSTNIDNLKFPTLKAMYFKEEKCLELFKNLNKKDEFDKEKEEYKENLKKEEDFKKIFFKKSVGINVLNVANEEAKNNENSTEPNYCEMFSIYIDQKDKDRIDALVLYVFLQFREIEFIEKYGSRDLFLIKVLFKFLKDLKNDYSGKVVYLKELLKEFEPHNKNKNDDIYKDIALQNTKLNILEVFRNFTVLYSSQFATYTLKDDKFISNLYKEYTENLNRNIILELANLITKFNIISEDDEIKYKQYMQDRFLLELDKNLPLSEYTLITYDFLKLKSIQKKSNSIVDIKELKQRLIDLQLYNNADYSEINLRILMYGIYGKININKSVKDEVFKSEDEFKNIFNADVLFEKFKNVASALNELEFYGNKKVMDLINSIDNRVSNSNLLEKLMQNEDINKVEFTLSELLFINLKMEKYFYNILNLMRNNPNAKIELRSDEKNPNLINIFDGRSSVIIKENEEIFILAAYLKAKTKLKKFKLNDDNPYFKTDEFKFEFGMIKILAEILVNKEYKQQDIKEYVKNLRAQLLK